jgi:hypothetical protein
MTGNRILNAVCLVLFPLLLTAQEYDMKGAHRLSTGLGHIHIVNGLNTDGKKAWLTEPSWSLNYDYWLGNKWAIGLQSDIVLETFVVEDDEGQVIEREKPVALVPVAIFKPCRHFSFIAGAGVEYEKNENMMLTRLGAEFGVELPKSWEAGVALVWDDKWGNYNSWVLEFTFTRNFFKRKNKTMKE